MLEYFILFAVVTVVVGLIMRSLAQGGNSTNALRDYFNAAAAKITQ